MYYPSMFSANVELIPSSFQLDVMDQKLSIEYDLSAAAANTNPLGDEDFEIDLTNSNNWDTVRRSISVSLYNLHFIFFFYKYERHSVFFKACYLWIYLCYIEVFIGMMIFF